MVTTVVTYTIPRDTIEISAPVLAVIWIEALAGDGL
jgi:hypothetical protein